MKKLYVILFLVSLVSVSYLFSYYGNFGAQAQVLPPSISPPPPGPAAVTGNEATINNFDIMPGVSPKIVAAGTAVDFTFIFTIHGAEFFNTCLSTAPPSFPREFRWAIYEDRTGLVEEVLGVTVPFSSFSGDSGFDVSNKVSFVYDTKGSEDRRFYGAIMCTYGAPDFSVVDSSRISVKVTNSSGGDTWGCIAGDGVYACSPGDKSDCSDVSACSGQVCLLVSSNLCGKCSGSGSCVGSGGTPGTPGSSQTLTWLITNPFKGGSKNPFDLVLSVVNWFLNIASALIVILIIYTGVRFMLAAGRPGEIAKAKNILFWALIGFAATLIGKGFVTLIISVLKGDVPTF